MMSGSSAKVAQTSGDDWSCFLRLLFFILQMLMFYVALSLMYLVSGLGNSSREYFGIIFSINAIFRIVRFFSLP